MMDKKTRAALERTLSHPAFRSLERDAANECWVVRFHRTRLTDATTGSTLLEALSRAAEFLGPVEES